MKRSIPLRGSMSAIDMARLTDGQRLALTQIRTWEARETRERELRLISSTLGSEDSQAAGRILMEVAESEGPNNPAVWFLLAAAEELMGGNDPVSAFKEGLAAYNIMSTCSLIPPTAPKGGK